MAIVRHEQQQWYVYIRVFAIGMVSRAKRDIQVSQRTDEPAWHLVARRATDLSSKTQRVK